MLLSGLTISYFYTHNFRVTERNRNSKGGRGNLFKIAVIVVIAQNFKKKFFLMDLLPAEGKMTSCSCH